MPSGSLHETLHVRGKVSERVSAPHAELDEVADLTGFVRGRLQLRADAASEQRACGPAACGAVVAECSPESEHERGQALSCLCACLLRHCRRHLAQQQRW